MSLTDGSLFICNMSQSTCSVTKIIKEEKNHIGPYHYSAMDLPDCSGGEGGGQRGLGESGPGWGGRGWPKAWGGAEGAPLSLGAALGSGWRGGKAKEWWRLLLDVQQTDWNLLYHG